jgi:hypothetical protein
MPSERGQAAIKVGSVSECPTIRPERWSKASDNAVSGQFPD